MMKNNLFICFLIIALHAFITRADAQNQTARERVEQRQNKQQHTTIKALNLSARARQMNATRTNEVRNAKWTRVIYRYLDLSKDKNAPLYYPVMPEDGRVNLFTMIFHLLSDKSVKAYEYLDGREIFKDEYLIDFKELLDRYNIYYEMENDAFVVNESDVPSAEVQGYYVKEACYFSADNSTYDVKILAICPVMSRQDDFGAATTNYPMFWVPYSEIRPYAERMPIMTSNLNNALLGTVDDFFRKNEYEGEIYKTTNTRNLAISQYAPTPDLMKKEQEKIEKQLADFEKNLWAEEDRAENIVDTKKKADKR